MQTSFHDFYATCQENEENGAENLRLEILSLLLKCMPLIESVIIKENEKYSGILSKRSRSLQCLTFFGLRWIFSLNSVSVLNWNTLKENEENVLLIESVIIKFVLDGNSTLKDQNQGYRNRCNIIDCGHKKNNI